jgi:hypothetical protein
MSKKFLLAFTVITVFSCVSSQVASAMNWVDGDEAKVDGNSYHRVSINEPDGSSYAAWVPKDNNHAPVLYGNITSDNVNNNPYSVVFGQDNPQADNPGKQ